MAVTGPNTEGFANIAAALCPTFSPAMDKNAGAIRPKRALGKGQVSVISQSGGLGFAFFDRARPRNLAFRHIVTTGNEAALDVVRRASTTCSTKARPMSSCCCSRT